MQTLNTAQPWMSQPLSERAGDNYAPNPFRPDWTPQTIARFFGWMGTHQPDVYFSLQVGPALVRFLEMAGVLRGRVIDYGCGPVNGILICAMQWDRGSDSPRICGIGSGPGRFPIRDS